MYNEIRPLAFKFDPTNPLLKPEFQALGFPPSWKKALKELRASMFKKQADLDQISIPIRSLNKSLRTLAPDLISVIPGAGTQAVADWLFCTDSFDLDLLRAIVVAWARVEYAKAPEISLNSAIAQIMDEPLIWQPLTVDLTNWSVGKNGTAQERSGLAYNLLPEYIASLLCKPDTVIQHGTESFSLLRCPTSPGSNVAELISWPPLYVDDAKQSGPHSLLISITVQTVPFQPYPVINVEFGIRRWVDANDLKGKLKGQTHVYMRTSVPWLEGLNNTQSFQVGRVRWERNEGPQGAVDWSLVWGDHFGDILQRLNPNHNLLMPEWFRRNIPSGFKSDDGTNAAFVYNTRMGAHEAGAGLMPGDRHPIFAAIADRLSDYVIPEQHFNRVGPRTSRPNHDLYDFDKVDDQICKQRREQIAGQVGAEVTIEMYYQRPSTAREMVETIAKFLGLSQPTKLEESWEVDGLRLTMRCVELGALGSALVLNPQILNKADQAFEAIQQRITEVKTQILPIQQPCLTIVELGGKDEFEDVLNSDPKSALRIGFSQTGRVSQFLDAGSDQPIEERGKKAILDGFRQLGMLPKLSHVTNVKGHPEGMNYVGIWIVRQNPKNGRNNSPRLIPIFVHVDSETGKVHAHAYGFEEWQDYRSALLRMGIGQVQFFERSDQAQAYIQEKIEELTGEGKPILLICDAQNIRTVWKGMQNKFIERDVLSIDGAISRPISDYPGLRVIRSRGGIHEVPEWYAIKSEGETDDIGFAKGLFQINDRVFGSIGGKPFQFKNLSRMMSKFIDEGNNKASPAKSAWNPGFYELTVAAMQQGDDPSILATLTSQLRHSSIQYEDATASALPLHLAHLMGEYILTPPGDEE